MPRNIEWSTESLTAVAARNWGARYMQKCQCLLVELNQAATLAPALRRVGVKCWIASADAAAQVLAVRTPAFVVIDAGTVANERALACVTRLRAAHRELPLVLVVERSSEVLAIAALNAGVSRYLTRPVSDEELSAAVRLAAEHGEPVGVSILGAVSEKPRDRSLSGGERLIGSSAPIDSLRAQLRRVAARETNVLITGETGAGKELVAELIHENSQRSGGAFVCLNAAAIPESLLESELFGYEQGAFTGASRSNPGKLATASAGTVFLDEIGDAGESTQAKLLRVLDGKQVYRLGGGRPVTLDVRMIAATNQDLEAAVAADRFRRDLYYRLNVVRLHVPPLRDRIEDLPELVAHYVSSFNDAFKMRVEGFSAAAAALLLAHTWPGNIRELRNVVEAVFVSLPETATGLVDLPSTVAERLTPQSPRNERQRLICALEASNWNKTQAASRLTWSRMTVYRKMDQYRIARVRGR